MFNYIEIGEILKPFRAEGELLAVVEDKFKADTANAKAIFIETNGLKVPFFIEKIESDGEVFYIKFEEFSGPEEIKKYNGLKIFLRDSDLSFPIDQLYDNDEDKLNLTGFHIVDHNSDQSFEIIRTEQYPQQLMAIILKDGQEKLIPLVEEFILEIDENNKQIIMKLPENLI